MRNSGNQRRYKRDVLRYVAIIKIAQRIGIPLATIGDALGYYPKDIRSAPKSGNSSRRNGVKNWTGVFIPRWRCVMNWMDALVAVVCRAAIARCVTQAINWASKELGRACWKMIDGFKYGYKTKAPQRAL